MKIGTLVIIGISLLLSMSGCSADDHYVNSTTTSTNWSASVNIITPCTVATAMSYAVAGDVVYFRGDVYVLPSMDESYCDGTGLKPVYYPANSGISGNPITFMAYPNDVTRPFFDNSANENKTCTLPSYGAANTDWIIWDGIDSKAVQQSGSTKAGRTTCFYNSHHCTIKNAQLEGCPGNSNNNAIMLRSVNYTTVENCLLWNVLPYPISPDLVNPAGIELYYAEHCIIRHVTMRNCTNGIYDKGYFRQNITVHNCIFHDMDGNMDRGIQSATKWNIQINKSFHNNIFLGIRAPITINHISEQTGGADGYDIYNNVFYDCDIGVAEVVYGDGGTQYCKGVRIHSNIISMPKYSFLDLNGDCEDVDSYIDYNDYYTTSSPMWWYNRPDAGYQKTSFELWNDAIPVTWENNSIESDPLFLNPGNDDPEGYRLGTGSPCIGAGKDGIDMGVFVTENEIIGYTESPPKECGDVNFDGHISIDDVIEAYRKIIDPEYYIQSMLVTDVDGDSRISINDVIEIYRRVVNPEYELHCVLNI